MAIRSQTMAIRSQTMAIRSQTMAIGKGVKDVTFECFSDSMMSQGCLCGLLGVVMAT